MDHLRGNEVKGVEMMRELRRCIYLGFVVSSMILLQAQDITKGSIAGVVRDASGAVLANARVRLDSPYGERTTTTSAVGEYVFPNLVVGSGYTIIIEQPGFATARLANLSVGVNQRTTADLILQIGSTTQAVDVTSEATETIDLVSTTVGANLDESLYKNIPVGRNISSIISMSPGVASGLGTGAANPSINGASGLENEYIINGANTTDPGFGGFGTYSRVIGSMGNGVNFDFIQEVQVKTGGFEAEYGQALGGVINILTKSGGNTYHGSVYGYFAPHNLAVDWKDSNSGLTAAPGTYVHGQSQYDFGADLGGYIKKDKLFWYAGFNPQFTHRYQSVPPVFADSKFGTATVDTRTLNYQAKVNYNLNPNHSFEGSFFGDPSTVPSGFVRDLPTADAMASNDTTQKSALDYGSRTETARYNGTLTPRWILSVNYSNYYNHFHETPTSNGIQVIDETASPTQTYNGIGFLEQTSSHVNEASASSSHLFNFLGGHTVVYGYQFENIAYNDTYGYGGPDFTLPNLPEFGAAAGATQHGGQVLRIHENPNDPTTPIVFEVTRGNYSNPVIVTSTRYHAGFIEDSWTLGRRITIKPGLRFEQQAETGNAFRYVFSHNWAPRIGVIVDPTGNRKSKFFANWGRFYEKIPLDIAVRSFSFETSVNGEVYKDTGPGNPPDLSASAYIPVAQGGLAPVVLGGASSAENVFPGTRAEYQDEVVGGYEHEFHSGMTFSGRFVYRHLRRVLEDTSGINVTQALAGVQLNYVVANPSATSDDFQNPVTCTGGPPACVGGYTANSGALGPDGQPDGFPNPTRIYKSAEFILSKRFSHGFQFYGSYRLSKLYGNYEGNFRNDNQQNDPNISSMFDFTNTDGRLGDQYKIGLLPADRTNQFKLFGNYEWKNFNFGASWIAESGIPLSAFNAHPAYINAGEIPIGGRGTKGRTPFTFPLDASASYTVKMGEQKRLKFGVNLFNLFNQQRVLYFDENLQLSGAVPNDDYKKPAGLLIRGDAYQSPFIAQLSARFEF
jgi:hypothetical protein